MQEYNEAGYTPTNHKEACEDYTVYFLESRYINEVDITYFECVVIVSNVQEWNEAGYTPTNHKEACEDYTVYNSIHP